MRSILNDRTLSKPSEKKIELVTLEFPWGYHTMTKTSLAVLCKYSLRTADAFPVVASLPSKNRPEMRLLFASYSS